MNHSGSGTVGMGGSALVSVTFHHVGSGGINFSGCACIEKELCFEHRFELGSKVFICAKASNEGLIRGVVVKAVFMNIDKWGRIVWVYRDNDNRCWLETELCTHEEVLELALEYQQEKLNRIRNSMKSICNK